MLRNPRHNIRPSRKHRCRTWRPARCCTSHCSHQQLDRCRGRYSLLSCSTKRPPRLHCRHHLKSSPPSLHWSLSRRKRHRFQAVTHRLTRHLWTTRKLMILILPCTQLASRRVAPLAGSPIRHGSSSSSSSSCHSCTSVFTLRRRPR